MRSSLGPLRRASLPATGQVLSENLGFLTTTNADGSVTEPWRDGRRVTSALEDQRDKTEEKTFMLYIYIYLATCYL